ncbi:MAG: choice-of-anchor I family protein [Pseudomonadota bacterium]
MYTLQILHASDLEGGIDAIDNAPNFAAVVDALETDAENQGIGSVLLSSGDNYIPGPFFNAGGDSGLADTYEGFYNAFFGLIDTSVLDPSADTDGDGFFDNDEIQAQINLGAVTFDAVYTTDVNGDGFKDYFEEIDTFEGRIDIAIANALGFDASAVGNHEFDAGTDAFENAINYDSEEGNSLSTSRYQAEVPGHVNFLQEVDTPGVQFPYLTANLDFSQDSDVGPLFTDEILTSDAFQSDLLSARDNPLDPAERGSDSNDAKIAPATIIEQDGEKIGVIGATTQLIASISSTGNIDDVSSPGTNDMAALAAVLQPIIDDVLNGSDDIPGSGDDVNKVILVSHLQQFALEEELASLLSGVDIILAGGSDTISADNQDRLRTGDTADQPYPLIVNDADDNPTAILSTDGEYSYVGRLVVTFDDNGHIIENSIDENVSGAFATDDQGVLDVTGAATVEEAIAASKKATDVQNLANEVTNIVTTIDGDIAGETDVFLNGNRPSVRTEETNFGNLTADANLVAAQAFDPDVLVSIKNGGGIRAPIGEIVDNGDGTADLNPPAANPLSGKQEGQISELDIDNSLRFDNGLSIVELTPEQLKIILEHAVAATEEGASPGQFAQVGGLHFSFDPEGTPQELGDGGAVITVGTRVQNVTLVDENGVPTQAIIEDGQVADGAPASIKVVTLDFLAGGGDGYPFSEFSDVTDIGVGEQQALSDFLTANHPEDGDTPFDIEDTNAGRDARVQNLAERSDTVDAPIATQDILFETVAEFQGEGGRGASEVVAHEDGKLYVTNGEQGRIDVFTIPGGEPAPAAALEAEAAEHFIDLTGLEGFDGVQSVAVKNGVVAVAISRAPVENTVFGQTVMQSQPGFVALFDAETKELISTIDVGNLPDQLTFSEDGNTLVVAGEGEKNADSDNDDNPLGTVSIIDVSDPANPQEERVDFTAFNGLEDLARDAGIRIQDGVSFAEDVEPEYAAISPDGTTAFVSLQENNAIAKIDLATGETIDIFTLGTVDFSSESQLDANNDDVIDIRNFDNLVGLRMADSIATYEVNGQTYVVTANEGDSRDFDEARVGEAAEDGLLDQALFDDLLAKGLIDEDSDTDIGLERLTISTIDGDTDGDGDIDVLHAFSSRSFSIFDHDGNLVFDSGPDFEKIIAELAPERFNDDDGDDGQDRSDDKGPEPEAITIGQIDDKIYAFIGLERDSGIMIYDVTDPANAFYVNYIPPQFVDDTPEGEIARHGPEIITFIPADESTTGNAQIAVSYEISGSTIVYDVTPAAPLLSIPEIQGAGHVSDFEGQLVRTTGIVTVVDSNGFFVQDAEGDGDDATSDGIFVFTGSAPAVAVGDEVEIRGEVQERVAGAGELSTTQFSTPEVTVLSSGNDLPEATIIGANGRAAPTEVIISDDELPVNLVDEPGDFNPDVDGIDFYESLEGMLVTIDNPVAISVTNRFNETWVVTDDGAGVTSPTGGLNDRGGLNINADADGFGDLNPERIQIQYDSGILPGFDTDLVTGDDLSDITGVVGYSFGNYEVRVSEAFDVEAPSTNTQEVTEVEGNNDRLSVATYNVFNVTSAEADGDAAQIAALAQQIVNNLGSPDIIGLQEIQDNSGVANDGTLDADETLQAIVEAIALAGGPEYAFVSAVVDEDGETGGVPGGNIRNAFLYNPERVEAKEIVTLEVDELTDLGVTDPTTFDGTRDPLLGVFAFNGEDVTIINNHFTSRFGSEPIYGANQPFLQAGEAEREAEAKAINEVVDAILAQNADAKVVVLGDLNTFEFTDELAEDLPGVGDEKVLTNLINQLPDDEAYTFVFQGNSQVLDHIFVTDSLLDGAEIDVVHTNNDFLNPASDHEPVVASFLIEAVDQLIVGTNRGDDLVGGNGDDTIIGRGGGDDIAAGAGDDDIEGGNGGDDIDAGDGDDEVNGGNGGDDIDGGDGIDTIDGGNGGDNIDGGDGDDDIEGGNGNDDIDGGDGNDTIEGGNGRDDIEGGDGDDDLGGGNGRDSLSGGDGEDMLDGGNNNDRLFGGAANDLLTGGNGRDTFVFELGDGIDIITDFEFNRDTIDLTAIDGIEAILDIAGLFQDGADAVIDLNGSDEIRLENRDINLLDDDDFLF